MPLPQDAPVITVVIPTFNRRDTVAVCVESVLSQDFGQVEVVVVDDGSTDGTAEALAVVVDPRLRVERLEHGGRCVARNKGVELATSPWVTFLDSDDRALDGWLAALVERLRAGASLVSCGALYVYPDGTSHEHSPMMHGAAFGQVEAQFLAGTFAVPVDLFRSVGGYRPGLDYGENTELGMRLGTEIALRGGSSAIDRRALVEVQAVHRPYDAESMYRSGVQTLGAVEDLLKKDPVMYATHLAVTGTAASRSGRGSDARRLLSRAWKIQPFNWRHPLRLLRTLSPVQGWR